MSRKEYGRSQILPLKRKATNGDFVIWLGMEDIDLYDCKEWDDRETHAFSVALERKYPTLKSKLCSASWGEFEHDGLIFQQFWYPYEDEPMVYVIGFGVAVFSARRGERQNFNLNAVIRIIQKIYPKVVKAFQAWSIEEKPHVCSRLLLNEEDLRLDEVYLTAEGLMKNGRLVIEQKDK